MSYAHVRAHTGCGRVQHLSTYCRGSKCIPIHVPTHVPYLDHAGKGRGRGRDKRAVMLEVSSDSENEELGSCDGTISGLFVCLFVWRIYLKYSLHWNLEGLRLHGNLEGIMWVWLHGNLEGITWVWLHGNLLCGCGYMGTWKGLRGCGCMERCGLGSKSYMSFVNFEMDILMI